MSAINNAGIVDHPYPVKDTLFFKIQGAPEAIKLTSELVKEITSRHGSDRFEFAATDEEAADLWQNRKYALMSSMALVPDARCWTTDVWYVHGVIIPEVQCFDSPASVPTSRLPQLVYETKQDMAKAGIKSTIVGHVGDGEIPVRFELRISLTVPLGNFHALMLFTNDEELRTVTEAVHRLVHRAIALEGTCEQARRPFPQMMLNLCNQPQVLGSMVLVLERRNI
jgi:D-lactate dehydrogenase (cytochrome)